MKTIKINYMRTAVIALVLLMACSEEVRIPDFLTAANVRIQFLSPADQLVNYADIANAQIKYSIFSENKDIESVEITFIYNNAETGQPEGPFDLITYTQADFDAADGAIRNETFSADQLAVLVGKASGADLNGGDNFVFSNRTTLSDGRVYPSTTVGGNSNVTPAITGNAATETFSVGWTSYVACPVPAGFATGTYLIEQIAGPDDPFFVNPFRFASEEVIITASSPIQRDINVTYFTFPGVGFTFLLVCNSYLVSDGSGVGCNSDLRWANANPPSPYSDLDDSVLTVQILENVLGDCGLVTAEPLTLKLTKVE